MSITFHQLRRLVQAAGAGAAAAALLTASPAVAQVATGGGTQATATGQAGTGTGTTAGGQLGAGAQAGTGTSTQAGVGAQGTVTGQPGTNSLMPGRGLGPPPGRPVAGGRGGLVPPAERQASAMATLGLTFGGQDLTITNILNTSPLLDAGFEVGDQIAAVNGQPVRSALDLLNQLNQLAAGNTNVSLTVNRDGAQQTMNVSANLLDNLARVSGGNQIGAGGQISAAAALGLTFSPDGLTISDIADDSLLSSLGLQVGDQIANINGQPVQSAVDLLRQLNQLAAGDAGASLTITRDGTQHTLNVSANILDNLARVSGAAQLGGTNANMPGRGLGPPEGRPVAKGRGGIVPPAEREISAAATLGLTFSGNLTISEITEDSPLNSLGLQVNDQVIALNGRPISNAAALLRGLTQLADTDLSASLTVMSNGTQRILSVSGDVIDVLAQAHAGTNTNLLNGNINQNGLDPSQNALNNAQNNQLPDRTARGTDRTSAAELLRQSLQSGAVPSGTAPATSSGATSNNTAAGATTGTTTNAATAGTSSSTTITQSGSGLIAPNAGVTPPAGTITPPTINPGRLPGGGLDNTTTNEGTTTSSPTTPTGGGTGAAATTSSGADISRSPTGLIAPNAGVAPPPGTITPPTVNPGRLPDGGGLDNTSTPGQSALPTTVLTPSGPRIAVPQAQGRAGATTTVPGVGPAGAGAPGQTGNVPVSPKASPQAKAAAGAKGGAKAGAGGAKAGGAASGGAAAGTGT